MIKIDNMKKIFLFLSLVLLIIFWNNPILAWDDCPYGEVNDTYPGKCHRYIDTDNNGICDHSEPAPTNRKPEEEMLGSANNIDNDLISGKELKEKTIQEVADIYKINAQEYASKLSEFLGYKVKPSDSFQLLHDNYGLEPSTAKAIAESTLTGKEINIKEDNRRAKTYPMLIIVIMVVILYAITYVLSKINKISLVKHRLIWNLVLLFSFLISGILGVLLVLRENFGIIIPLPFNILVWHVNTGIVMVVVSIFHIAWHWPYFKNIFK